MVNLVHEEHGLQRFALGVAGRFQRGTHEAEPGVGIGMIGVEADGLGEIGLGPIESLPDRHRPSRA